MSATCILTEHNQSTTSKLALNFKFDEPRQSLSHDFCFKVWVCRLRTCLKRSLGLVLEAENTSAGPILKENLVYTKQQAESTLRVWCRFRFAQLRLQLLGRDEMLPSVMASDPAHCMIRIHFLWKKPHVQSSQHLQPSIPSHTKAARARRATRTRKQSS